MGAINLKPVTSETRQTPFGPITTAPGMTYTVLFPLYKKICDAIDAQFAGNRTAYCNPLPLVPFEIPHETPWGNIPLKPQGDPDLMSQAVILHEIADGLDRGWSAPASILGSPVIEPAPPVNPVTPTTLSAELQAKLDSLANVAGSFVVFSHASPVYAEPDPIMQFPQASIYTVSGVNSFPASYADLKGQVAAILQSGGTIVGLGPMSDYDHDAAFGALVPKGFHMVQPTTQHPADGSRGWLITDFATLVAN